MKRVPRVLITPLNWGLGHATRCMPIIDGLLNQGAELILASDGRALALLKKEYPHLKTYTLPAYDIQYKGASMTRSIAGQLPKISRAIYGERKAVKKIVEREHIDIIISDNRYGCRSRKTHNIFITHQINIAIPNRQLELLTNLINHHFINRFDACWIPDFTGDDSLAGKLSNTKNPKHQYIGLLSRFVFKKNKKVYDLVAVLSGPEPQRTYLEEKIIDQLRSMNVTALIVQGKTESRKEQSISDHVNMISYLTAQELNEAMSSSACVLSRSGYSTIMDLAKLRKKAILIPTPGQTEQEFLARQLLEKKVFYTQEQAFFDLEKAMTEVEQYPGFQKEWDNAIVLKDILKRLLQ